MSQNVSQVKSQLCRTLILVQNIFEFISIHVIKIKYLNYFCSPVLLPINLCYSEAHSCTLKLIVGCIHAVYIKHCHTANYFDDDDHIRFI